MTAHAKFACLLIITIYLIFLTFKIVNAEGTSKNIPMVKKTKILYLVSKNNYFFALILEALFVVFQKSQNGIFGEFF